MEKTIFCCDKDQIDDEEDMIAEGEWDLSQLEDCKEYNFEDRIDLYHKKELAGSIRVSLKFFQNDVKIAKDDIVKNARKQAHDKMKK